MIRNVLRKHDVLKATGLSNSRLYEKIKAGTFPKPIKLDPNGRAVAWFEDEIIALQKAADERRAQGDR